MNTNDIVFAIDAEISRLQQVKMLLNGTGIAAKKKRGRPAATSLPTKATSFNPAEFTSKAKQRRTMSPEARARIADAQKKRWGKSKRAEKKVARNAEARATEKTATRRAARKTTIKKAVATKKAAQPDTTATAS